MFGRMKDRLLLWQAMRVARRRGVTIIEYTLLAGLIGVVLIATFTSAKTAIASVWDYIITQLNGIVPSS